MFKSYTTFLCGRKGQSERQLLRHQAAAKSNQRLQASFSCRTTSSFSKVAHLLTPALAQDWIEKKCLVSLDKANGHRIRQISIHWTIICGAGTLSEIHAKTNQRSELNTALLSIWNDLTQEFIDKAILSF